MAWSAVMTGSAPQSAADPTAGKKSDRNRTIDPAMRVMGITG
jgi:hypothetical protein